MFSFLLPWWRTHATFERFFTHGWRQASKRQKARGNEWVPGIPIHLKLVSLFVRPAAVKGSLLNLIRFHLGFDFIKYLRLDSTAYYNEILALFFPLNQNWHMIVIGFTCQRWYRNIMMHEMCGFNINLFSILV